MGGPFWQRKDARAWSVPKGEHGPEEDPAVAARREFTEELGQPPPGEPWLLGTRRQSGAKQVTVFALEGDLDPTAIHSNDVTIEWPRGSGRTVTFPEIDRAAWLALDEARDKLVAGQVPFLDLLAAALADRDADTEG